MALDIVDLRPCLRRDTVSNRAQCRVNGDRLIAATISLLAEHPVTLAEVGEILSRLVERPLKLRNLRIQSISFILEQEAANDIPIASRLSRGCSIWNRLRLVCRVVFCALADGDFVLCDAAVCGRSRDACFAEPFVESIVSVGAATNGEPLIALFIE